MIYVISVHYFFMSPSFHTLHPQQARQKKPPSRALHYGTSITFHIHSKPPFQAVDVPPYLKKNSPAGGNLSIYPCFHPRFPRSPFGGFLNRTDCSYSPPLVRLSPTLRAACRHYGPKCCFYFPSCSCGVPPQQVCTFLVECRI